MDGSRMRLVLGVLAAVCLIDSTRSPGNLLDMRGRVADRRTIEEVYWRHRIWPSANPGPKPPLAAVLTTSLIRNRVEDDLLKRAALVRFWERALSATQIQAEIDRMAA